MNPMTPVKKPAGASDIMSGPSWDKMEADAFGPPEQREEQIYDLAFRTPDGDDHIVPVHFGKAAVSMPTGNHRALGFRYFSGEGQWIEGFYDPDSLGTDGDSWLKITT